jgi:hypothetical protein
VQVAAAAAEPPTQFTERYVGWFYAYDLKQYQQTFEFPAVHFTGGVFEIFSDPAVPTANFENVEKTGWGSSRIDSINVLLEPLEAALVEFSFSRMDASGNAFFNSTSH